MNVNIMQHYNSITTLIIAFKTPETGHKLPFEFTTRKIYNFWGRRGRQVISGHTILQAYEPIGIVFTVCPSKN